MAYRLDIKEKKNGTYIIIEKKFWDKEKKKPRTLHYKTLGYLHELQKQFPDPIAHFKEVVAQMNAEEKANSKLTLTIDMNEELPKETHSRYNMGYAVILKIYHELELDRFFNNKARHESFKYSTDSIMKLLTITRILHPSSKKASYEYKDRFFERFDFELHDVYRSLSHFSKISLECQQFISDQINAKFGRDTTLMYFDVTNLYFEIDEPDDMRKRGKEKNNRTDPIVQMALAMDANGIPLYYKLFPGNTHDSKTFIPVFKDVCVRFAPGRVIAVADMGCTSSNPKKHNKDTVHGAAAYIKNITFDKKTGEIYEEPGKKLTFDKEKAEEDAKYDGYYCIITSELDMPDQRVIEIYRGLFDIEDNFRISKSDLEIRPVYVSRKDRINAHVLICFISLVIIRLIEKKIDYKFTPEQIITCLKNISCSLEQENVYLFDYRSIISDEIGKTFGIDFTKKRLRLNEIKNILATAKKN